MVWRALWPIFVAYAAGAVWGLGASLSLPSWWQWMATPLMIVAGWLSGRLAHSRPEGK
jgi:hypothetical protein